MSKVAKYSWIVAGLALVAGLTHVAEAAKVGAMQGGNIIVKTPSMPKMAFKLDCSAAGNPAEFPKGIAVTNIGGSSVPAGTKIHWKVPSPLHQGNYTFGAPLSPGKSLMLSNVNTGGLEAGTSCQVAVLK